MPVLVGGVVSGILSSIPLVSAVNCFFCAWMLLGAALAVKLAQDKAKTIEMGEAALIGALAGAVCAGITWSISAVLNLIVGGATLVPAGMEGQMPEVLTGGGGLVVGLALGCVFSFIIYPLFGALGGLLGGLIFKPIGPPPGGGDTLGGPFGQPGGPNDFGNPPGGGFGPPPGGGFGPPPGGGFGPPPGGSGGGFGPPPS
jgi:hypothetical protein